MDWNAGAREGNKASKMPSVSDLLRTSKLAQVAKPSARNKLPFTLRGSHFPTHQIIETKPSSLSRNDWGLKNSIPTSKYGEKTRYMVVEKLDNLERMTEFEYNGGSQWNRIRFQELGIVPKFSMGQKNPIFNFEENKLVNNNKSADNYRQIVGDSQLRMISQVLNVDKESSSVNRIQTLKHDKATLKLKLNLLNKYRREFKEWLLERYPESLLHKRFNSMELKDKAAIFLQEKLHSQSRNNPKKHLNNKVIGTGGLSYNLGGRLKTTPHGIRDKVIVPGRILSNTSNRDRSSQAHGGEMYSAAIGGFFARANFNNGTKISYGMGSFLRELVLPFEVNNVSMENNGRIHMTASTITVMKPSEDNLQSKGKHHISMNIDKHNLQNRQFRRTNSKNEINDLLLTLENTGKN